ncbi:SHOCT domain-containing protein [Geminocystis sp.]|uniref:SHOCT domain-containing protein n=1 Tax=Geminocystis sp. TaxID=2664100 RepID=UPI0035933590
MAKSYFISRNSQDLDKIYRATILWFKGKQYEVEGTEKQGIYLIQAGKTSTIRTLLGSNLAFKILIYFSNDTIIKNQELVVETTRGKWIQNIAGAGFAGIFTGGFTVMTGIATAGWGFLLENELISYLENELNFQRITTDISNKNNQDISENNINNSSPINLDKNSEDTKIINELEEEINKLEIAFTDEILTEAEFTRKKAILERKIDDYEINLVIEDKISKLQSAFSQGILNQEEYEEKVNQIEANMRETILQERLIQRNKTKIIKLKEALNNGVITKEEYQRKISNL